MSTELRRARRGGQLMSDDTLDGILAAVLALAVFALLMVIGIWAAEAYAERVATPTTATAAER